ncbi:MAG: TetR/AcrR family transcriptional regulator [Myxococcaceae bacterium]
MAKTSPPRDLRVTLLGSATRLIAERGFSAVSLQDIADDVGVTKQAVLYHFKSKDTLKEAVIQQQLARTNAEFMQILARVGPNDVHRLEIILEHLQRYLKSDPHASAVLLRFLLDQDGVAIDQIKNGIEPWLSLVETEVRRGQKSGALRPELNPETALQQIGMLALTNFALLQLGDWSKKSDDQWQARRLGDLIKTIGFILFPDSARAKARRSKKRR